MFQQTVCRRDSGARAYMDVLTACLGKHYSTYTHYLFRQIKSCLTQKLYIYIK